jgi:hypothetical protein
VILRGLSEKFNLNENAFKIEEVKNLFQSKSKYLSNHPPPFQGFIKRDSAKQQQAIKGETSYSLSLDHHLEMKNELRMKIHPSIMNYSNDDVLKYAHPSFSKMILYFNPDNSYFPGKEEEHRFITFNLNHGPGEDIWYGVNSKEAAKFRKLVKSIHSLDLFSKDVEWFTEVDFFMQNKINVMYGKQCKGDIIMINKGCHYWYTNYIIKA